MAHPKLSAPATRIAGTAGLTAALLLVPLASGAAAVELDQELESPDDAVEALSAELEALEGDELDELLSTLIGVGAEHAPDEAANTVDPDGDDEGAAAAGDGEVTPMAAPAPSPAPAPAASAAPAPANDGGAAALAAETAAGASGSPALSGARSSLRSESSLSFQALPPVVSAPFSFATTPAPLTAAATSTGGALSMSAVEAAMTSGAGVPAGAPGSLVATASGLLLLLGGAHVLHRRGALERVHRS